VYSTCIIRVYHDGIGNDAATPAPACFGGLLRPHLTSTRSPSTSSPFAQASAARSAVGRSLKLTNAHLEVVQQSAERRVEGMRKRYVP
jgi:hypothetical protein